jgi:broad specificity phosphatase PhoE
MQCGCSLSEEGIRQARLAGMRMKDWGIEMVYSSDMLRAKETAYFANLDEFLSEP